MISLKKGYTYFPNIEVNLKISGGHDGGMERVQFWGPPKH
jgi:hypothetical protein